MLANWTCCLQMLLPHVGQEKFCWAFRCHKSHKSYIRLYIGGHKTLHIPFYSWSSSFWELQILISWYWSRHFKLSYGTWSLWDDIYYGRLYGTLNSQMDISWSWLNDIDHGRPYDTSNSHRRDILLILMRWYWLREAIRHFKLPSWMDILLTIDDIQLILN